MAYLTREDVSKVLRAAYKESARDHLMLLMSAMHGLRASEVAALTLGDVSGGSIRVARVKGSNRTEHPLMASHDVLWNEPRALAQWLEQRSSRDNVLFTSRKGGGLDRKSVGEIAKYYMLRTGMDAGLAHHHSFKHFCCSHLCRSGVGVEFVKTFVGHKDIKNTVIYMNISDREAAGKAQAAFGGIQ